MNKIKNILPWATIVLYLAILLPLIGAKKKDIKCQNINVKILDETNNFFIEEGDVLSMLNDKGESIIGTEINSVNTNKLEEFILLHPSVKKANVHRTLQGDIEIKIIQRNPILRIINKNRESFYVDEEGKIMPLSRKYTAHVLIASGNIDLNYTKLLAQQKEQIGDKSVDNSNTLLLDLYKVASYIYHDEFWKAQMEQVYVNRNNFELVPRVGTHIIEMGTIENYKNKFRNLKALYEQGFPSAGWNSYNKINLKYNNQVICTKR
ncbi:MAG: hypothetical protein PF517_01360 [Salinivirgaceae bacterium]|jgi:cell division protein FtsQ|nr:hypothetical protein [Salinivirgaceae bacterium]